MQLQDLIKIRLQPLINTVQLDLDRWDKLLLSLGGKDYHENEHSALSHLHL